MKLFRPANSLFPRQLVIGAPFASLSPVFMLNLLLLYYLTLHVVGKVREGILQKDSNFAYLDRFCYESETGQLDYYFRYPTNYPVPSLLLYFDDPDQWLRAYTVLQTCEERVELLTNNTNSNGIVRLSPLGHNIYSKCIYQDGPDNTTNEFVVCTGTKTFRSSRSRWWFMGISTCNEESTTNEGIKLEFRLTMTNGEPTDFFTYQFSFDQRYMLLITVVFILINAILFIAAAIVGWQLAQRRLHHYVYKLYCHCIFLKVASLFCHLVHYLIYAVNGFGLQTMEFAGRTIAYGEEILFMIMLLVISRGLNVTKMKLGKTELCVIMVFTITIICGFVALHAWEIQGYDPALSYFYSESLAGKLIAGWKVVASTFLVISCCVTMKEAPQKRWFYTAFILFFVPWFFAYPVVLVLANNVLDNWVREEVVYLVDNCVTVYGFIIFIYLSWPSNANKNFPFHIRTTQVSCNFDPQVNYAATEDNGETPKVTVTTRRPLEEQCRHFEVIDVDDEREQKKA